ncbi:hypothetical protein P5704_028420 (plasmid) [Pseudomonas sp. FeN3W]|nr:hypothetical protein P5704_028420 [Pseudomonas sp. FeN3W]
MTTPTEKPGAQPIKQILDHIDKRIESEMDKRRENTRTESRHWPYLTAITAIVILSLASLMMIVSMVRPAAPLSETSAPRLVSKSVSFSPDMANVEDRLAALTALLVMNNGSVSKEEQQALNVFLVGRYKAEPQHPIGSIPKAVLENKASGDMFDSGALYKKFLGYQALINPSDKALSAVIEMDMPVGEASYQLAQALDSRQIQSYTSMVSTLLLNELVSATKTDSDGRMLTEYAEAWQAFINTLGHSDEPLSIENPEDHFSIMAKDGQYQAFTNELRNRLNKRTLVSTVVEK